MGDQLWMRQFPPDDAPRLINRDVLVPRPAGLHPAPHQGQEARRPPVRADRLAADRHLLPDQGARGARVEFPERVLVAKPQDPQVREREEDRPTNHGAA